MKNRPGFSLREISFSSPSMRRNPTPSAHTTLHILLDMSNLQSLGTCNVGKENSVRLICQPITTQSMGNSLPSVHPFIHSARLSTRTSSPSIVIGSSSGMGSMIVSVRSLEKNTLAYGSAMVLSDFSPVIQFSPNSFSWEVIPCSGTSKSSSILSSSSTSNSPLSSCALDPDGLPYHKYDVTV
jgi:hypothetical protein